VPEPLRHYTSQDNTIEKLFSREKTIIYLVHNILGIPDIKEKHIQIQYNNNKIYNVILYLHYQTWPC
jgi:hypothetical protein